MAGNKYVFDKDVMMTGKMMSQNFIDHMNKGFEMWKSRKRYSIFKV